MYTTSGRRKPSFIYNIRIVDLCCFKQDRIIMSKVRLLLNNTSGGNNNNGKGDENTKIEMRKIITLAYE